VKLARLCAVLLVALVFFPHHSPAARAAASGQRSARAGIVHPFGVTLDGQGNVYVVDAGAYRVVKLSPRGTMLMRWGRKGSAPGQFAQPQGIAVDAVGNVYVSDWSKDCVDKFAPSGAFRAQWGKKHESMLFAADGIVVDAHGDLLVGTGRGIVKLSPGGRMLGRWDVRGASFVHGLTLDARGNVYATDWEGRVTKLSPNGKLLAQWGNVGKRAAQMSFAEGVAVDVQGRVYVADWGKNRIDRFTASGRALAPFGRSYGSDSDQFFGPEGVAVDASGSLYVADGMNGRVQKLSPTGKLLASWS